MIRATYFLLLPFFMLIYGHVAAQNFGGNPASVKWRQVNTPFARVIFPAGADSQANRVTNVLRLLNKRTAGSIGQQQRKWNVLMQYHTTIPNAYVRLAPVMSELYMTPAQDNFSTGSIRWDDNLIIHEHRHMQQFSNFNKGFTRVFSFLLGQEGQLLANGMTVPDYFFEGDAVWQETLVSAQGRGRLPAFYNGFKSLWLDNRHYSWMKLRNGSYKHYIPDHYQLGYLLTAYGYEKFGENFWKKVAQDAVSFRAVFYPFNQAIERYSGKTYKQFRTDAMNYFKDKSFPKRVITTAATEYLTKADNTVTDYQFPVFINNDSILVSKKSYKEITAFYILAAGKEKKIRVKDVVLDDYFSYRNGKVVYAAFKTDARRANRDYSVIQLLDIYTGQQRQLTSRSKYFSPDINEAGTEVLAVQVNTDGSNQLCRIDALTGQLLQSIPNPRNYFFTQTKYIDSNTAISAARNPQGNMVLVKVELSSGALYNLTPFSFNVLGYPFVKGDTVYFSAMHKNADAVFALNIRTEKLYKLTDNVNGVYHPAVNTNDELVVSAFTSSGYRLAKYKAAWKEISALNFIRDYSNYYTDSLQTMTGAGALYSLADSSFEESSAGREKNQVSRYRKTFGLFNFHSWRPVIDDPEFGYSFFSDNVLSSFRNNISYTYNRSDRSHTAGFNTVYAGWLYFLSLGTEFSFNRTLDTAVGKAVSFNSAKLSAGISLPLRHIGRTNKFFNTGISYNLEQYYYRGVGKNLFNNKAIKYISSFLQFRHFSQQARQHVNPRWGQTISLSYRHAFNANGNQKFVSHASFYFPGLFTNHSLVIDAAWQKRDSLPDLFSRNFSYARGYEALSTRRMYKLGLNYQLPVAYPDWGFANIIFFQRIRSNAFFDYNNARARVNGLLTEIRNRSTGVELYFDTKIWNSLPVNFGLRFSRLLDTDLINPGVKNRWELIIPIGLIPD